MEVFEKYNHFFFVGIAGTGMSAIAQYLKGIGKKVSGSDRLFNQDKKMLIQEQFEKMGINCFFQDASGVDKDVDVIVISTAIEETNIELKKARQLGIPVMKRSELLASISKTKKTIAVGGTSGKSTTSAMIFHILQTCGVKPSIMSGAGLTSLQEKGLPGNAWVGDSEWLVIEADESDGSIVNYISEISLLLNVDRDHKEYDELLELFSQFKKHTVGRFIVNRSHPMSKKLSQNKAFDFSSNGEEAGFVSTDFTQEGFSISFKCNDIEVKMPLIGRHNMENATAAIAACQAVGLAIEDCAKALENHKGIYRRTQLAGIVNGIYVIDDFAHNPAEVVCAIKASQAVGKRVFAWFQPHGFGPLKFMHKEIETDIPEALRKTDVFLLSDVYYAGGTVTKEYTSTEVATEMLKRNNNIEFFPNRKDMLPYLKHECKEGDVIIIMGARDTTLSDFAKEIVEYLA
ncbi:MAG TPA: Mur ligase domain-containing protein [Paludibacteraceae bacterium]|nr:Mur ligase domain-containing protein [Paludibacteraceae bacterium]HOU67350.1 Mur ligase domain-containing protein [Paludibacteraceae bacterium]HPH62143.1 Mur ligase domain-containing protein [Paludibacteraceae bacterium]HQF49826.1 Mur ligase domain-containing protein [Paludibacteraceae bacterium]